MTDAAGEPADPADTIDRADVARFAALAETWWDPNGPLRALHRINPPRLAFLRDRAVRHFPPRPGADPLRPLAGLRALDIGCGGGLVTEPLARMGAEVVGLDAAAENRNAAQRHAQAQGLEIDYRVGTAETLAATGAQFDLVVALEIIEHVPNPESFLDACAALVRPGGLIVFGTLSRTLRALLLAVVAAEYLLGWIPRGTHDWRRFIGPDALGDALHRRGLRPEGLAGLRYDPFSGLWSLSHDTAINYLLSAAKPDEEPAPAA